MKLNTERHVAPETLSSLPVQVTHRCFTGADGVAEHFLAIEPTEYADFETQLDWIWQAYEQRLQSLRVFSSCAVLRRFHCSDLQNQAELLRARPFSNPGSSEACAVSWVDQAPCGNARVAMVVYLVDDPRGLAKTGNARSVSINRGELRHHWAVGQASVAADSKQQTEGIFKSYCDTLDREGMSLLDNVIRTWLYVKDVDNNYQGLVDARNEIFDTEGLGQDSHTIASTGIEGGHADPHQLVTLDSYAIGGVRPQQVEYLSALDFLSPTQLYGVAFERATSVAYRDRKQVFISGTASIDWQGNIVHPGEIAKQLERTLVNIEALLAQAALTLADMMVFTVYVRDPSDLPFVKDQMQQLYPATPMVVVKAPVCRPGWLIEIEGIAIAPHESEDLPLF